jgi:hypothetical protein
MQRTWVQIWWCAWHFEFVLNYFSKSANWLNKSKYMNSVKGMFYSYYIFPFMLTLDSNQGTSRVWVVKAKSKIKWQK